MKTIEVDDEAFAFLERLKRDLGLDYSETIMSMREFMGLLSKPGVKQKVEKLLGRDYMEGPILKRKEHG